MLEENRQKALKEIDAQLEENQKVRNIVWQLQGLLNVNKYDDYINLIIKEQPLLTKYYLFPRKSHIPGVEGLRSIMIPDDNYTITSILEEYADGNNPIFLRQVRTYDNQSTIVYKNIETEEELTEREYQIRFGTNPAMTIEVENPNAFFNDYQYWYFKLLSQHTVEEVYEILKNLSECENGYYRTLEKTPSTIEED